MSKTTWAALVLIVAGLLVLGLVACFQISQPPLQSPPTSTGSATIWPTLTSQPILLVSTTTATTTVVPTPTLVNLIPLPPTISGVILDAKGPLAGAIVQIHGSSNKTTTANNGTFTLTGIKGTTPIILIAGLSGYNEGWVTLNPSAPDWKGASGISITLKPLPEKDNSQYPWFSFQGVQGTASCGLCHREYQEWQADAHSQSAQNPRFITVYTGTDVNGRQGQLTVYGSNGAALSPDPSKPYYGPGFQLDNPSRAGNCATCHTPVASTVPNRLNCGWLGCHTTLTSERAKGVIDPSTFPIHLTGNAAEGITCDFCHKIGDVILDPKTNLPFPDMPGILSMRLYRPDEGQQVFFGTLVDVNRRVSYSPLESESKFCASCHYGVFGGVVGAGTVTGGTLIYNSYGEWLASPYSNPKTGKTCQQCHMPVSSANWFVFPDQGGLTRDYATLHNHTMLGISDETLMKNAVTMKSSVAHNGGTLQVQVSITNDKTGHDVPTDAPTRSVMLVVEVLDANGNTLSIKQGPILPNWTGNYAGQPGKAFAKVLRDDWTGETPTAAYWRPVTIVEDTRLAPMATDTTAYLYDLAVGKGATVKVKLVYRRAFQELEQQKGWTDPDLIMAEENIEVK